MMVSTREEEERKYHEARIFINPKGDWKVCEKLIKVAREIAERQEARIFELVRDDHLLRETLLKAYDAAPKKDCLYYDSPISPHAQTSHLRKLLRWLKWDGVREFYIDESKKYHFAEQIKTGCKWLLKFKDDSKDS